MPGSRIYLFFLASFILDVNMALKVSMPHTFPNTHTHTQSFTRTDIQLHSESMKVVWILLLLKKEELKLYPILIYFCFVLLYNIAGEVYI